MYLAGDIGGTKTHLAFFVKGTDGPRLVLQESYHSRDYSGLAGILAKFLATHKLKAERVCLGIAGPVRGGRVETPNLPWVIDAEAMRKEIGCGPVILVNDLEANAHGLAALGPEDFAVLNAGDPTAKGNAALIAAGTGLGEAGLYWDGSRHLPFASEGGHCDFAPRDPLQEDLAEFVAKRFGHVSYERIVSGPGLHNVYDFLREQKGQPDELPKLMERLGVSDQSAAIAIAAMDGQSELCRQALSLVVSIYGAEAGNLALKVLAVGGVFLGGGVAPKILPALREPEFLQAFTDKGRMRPLLEAIPVRVVLNENTALLGAARVAAGLSSIG
jgi:glucokinase